MRRANPKQRPHMTAAQLRDRFSIEDKAQSLILRVDGDPRRLPAQPEFDETKSALRDACDRAMAAKVEPFAATLKRLSADMLDLYIDADQPQQIAAKLRRSLRLLKRDAERAIENLRDQKQTKEREMAGLLSTWRPSKLYQRTDRRKLAKHTIQLGIAETFINGTMLYATSFKGGLLASVAASILPSIINLGGGAFLGDVILRHVRRENANRMTRAFSWKGFFFLLSLVVSTNVGFAYLRVTGSLEGLANYILTGRIDYTVPAIASLGLLLFAWSASKWWYSAHPNLQIEKVGRALDRLDAELSCVNTEFDAATNSGVANALADLDLLEQQERDDLVVANAEFAELVEIVERLDRDLDLIQQTYEEALNDYSFMIFDGVGVDVPAHYKTAANLGAVRPPVPDVCSFRNIIDRLERDYQQLRMNANEVSSSLNLEPDQTLGSADEADDAGPLDSNNEDTGGVSSTAHAADNEDVKGPAGDRHNEAAE
ncbi:MAG: hypothetical protein AB7T86_04930 [Xanthobacteraceae bacterium]